MFDLIVSGGLAVMPAATEAADIGVAGGKIAAIGAPGSLAAAGAARTVDATGQIVIPGGVDPHIHCSSPIPFPGRNEDMLSAPPDQVSRAALHGGTTTLLDFAPCPPDQPLQQSIEMRQREWAGACYCDYGFHLLLHGKLSPGRARRACRRRSRAVMPRSRCSPPISGRTGWAGWCSSATSGRC